LVPLCPQFFSFPPKHLRDSHVSFFLGHVLTGDRGVHRLGFCLVVGEKKGLFGLFCERQCSPPSANWVHPGLSFVFTIFYFGHQGVFVTPGVGAPFFLLFSFPGQPNVFFSPVFFWQTVLCLAFSLGGKPVILFLDAHHKARGRFHVALPTKLAPSSLMSPVLTM